MLYFKEEYSIFGKAVTGLKVKMVIIAVISVILITSSIPGFADPLSDELKRQQQQLQQNKDTYGDIDRQIAQSEENVEKLDEQINDLLYQIDETKGKIDKTRQDIGNAEKDIVKAQNDLDNEKDIFNKRLRVMYVNGTEGYIDVLLESQSFSDFISRVDLISRIIKYDMDTMKDLRAKSDAVNKRKQDLADENAKLAALQKENEGRLNELASAKSSQSRMIADLKRQQNMYASRISQYQAQVSETLRQIQAMKEAQKSKNGNGSVLVASRSGTSASGEAIVAYASDFLGVPYVWGGNTPSGFDCSGFTKYVFAHFGISLDRRASEQALQGVPVSRNQLQPGDLVFFGNPVYHVGIYVGNDCFIHAPTTGDVVKITPLKWMNLTGARRLR